MSGLKFDDEIEVSNDADFKEWHLARFLADERDCSNYIEGVSGFAIATMDENGYVCFYRYARPATPRILIDGINYPCTKMQAVRIAEIKKELEVQYKIITGEA